MAARGREFQDAGTLKAYKKDKASAYNVF